MTKSELFDIIVSKQWEKAPKILLDGEETEEFVVYHNVLKVCFSKANGLPLPDVTHCDSIRLDSPALVIDDIIFTSKGIFEAEKMGENTFKIVRGGMEGREESQHEIAFVWDWS